MNTYTITFQDPTFEKIEVKAARMDVDSGTPYLLLVDSNDGLVYLAARASVLAVAVDRAETRCCKRCS